MRDAVGLFEQAEQRVFARYGVAPEPRFVELSEPPLRVRVLEWGEGLPLLLVPGRRRDRSDVGAAAR